MNETLTRIDPTKLRVWLDAHGLVYKDVSYNLVQAISYAAHMCYKLAEQNKLAKDKED